MHSFTNALFLALATSSFPSILALSADPIAVKIVQQQFINAKIVPDEVPVFNPIGTLQLDFKASVGVTTVGEAIAQANTTQQPSVTAAGTFNGTSAKYTVLMVDTNYPGSSNPNGLYLHWLQNDATLASDGTITNSTAAVIPYAGPAPPSGSGPHRYTVLLYAQLANFTAPSTPAPNSGVHLINLASYISSAGLGTPLAGSYFTVEVGTATVSVSPTTAVDSATFSASSTAARSGSSTVSGTGAGTSATQKSSADLGKGVTIGSVLLSAFGLAAVLA